MKKKFTMVVVVLLFFLGFSTVSQATIQTFDSDNAGWLNFTLDNNGNLANSDSSWNTTGGNSGGHVSGFADNGSTRLYGIQAPFETDFFGDLTGQILTVDYRIDGMITGPVNPKVRFYFGYYDGGSRYWVSNDTFSWGPNGDTDWTTHRVQLLESNFLLWPNQNAGDMSFTEVLQSYNDIGLVFADGFTNNSTLGFSSSEGATIHVDNFGTIPVPGAIWLLGSGIIGLSGLRRKARQ